MSYFFSRPIAEKASYSPNEYVNFRIYQPNYSLLSGSLRLSAEVAVVHNALPLADTEYVFHDADIGFECLINSVVVKMNGKVIENIQDYNRMRKTIVSGNKTANALAGESDSNCAGRTGIQGHATRDQMLPANRPGFSIKLDIGLNKANMPIGSNKGPIEISIRLEQPVNAFYGSSADATTTYTLSSLITEWRGIPEEDMHKQDLVMSVSNSIKQIIDSSNQQVSISTPIPSNKVFGSLINTTNLSTTTANSFEMQEPSEGVHSLEWSINDSLAYEKFPFENSEEIRYNYLQAVNGRNNGQNNISLGQLLDKKKWALGFQYYRFWDQNSKFGMNMRLNNALAVNKSYTLFLYFNGVITV